MAYLIASYFQGMYISQTENFHEVCTRKVATLGTWVWFSINILKINSMNRSNFEIRKIYTPQK